MYFTLISDEVEEYCEKHSSAEDGILYEINRETHLQTVHPRMLSGQCLGLFLEILSRSIKPKAILEIGTFTGYSTICLAKGLLPEGIIHTIEHNIEYKERIEKNLNKAGIFEQCVLHIDSALNAISDINEEWDLVFIDADKCNYLNYYKLIVPKIKKGGILIADNVLWGGKVLYEPQKNDKDTSGLIAFNNFVKTDNRVRNVLLPFRDGIMIAEKI